MSGHEHDHDHDHEHEHDHDHEEVIVLVDEEGQEHEFYLYRIVEVDGKDYALLEPAEDEGELVILRIEGDLDSGNLVSLDDDEWDRVVEALDDEELFGDGVELDVDGDWDDEESDDYGDEEED